VHPRAGHRDIHVLSGIRTHDPCVRSSEDISCLRPLAGHGSRAVACFLFVRSEAVTVGSMFSGHGCLVFVNVYVFFCVCEQVEALR
jgi:hypothetical protein